MISESSGVGFESAPLFLCSGAARGRNVLFCFLGNSRFAAFGGQQVMMIGRT